MQQTSVRKGKRSPIERVHRAFQFGRKWCGVYWKQTFSWDGREVLVSMIPVRLLQMIERDETTIERVIGTLSASSVQAGLADFTAYKSLWEEAVYYALGCRQDTKMAETAAAVAVKLASEGKWMDAFYAAKQASELEKQHAGRARYWHGLLYTIADILLASGYERQHPFLRSYEKASARDPRPGPERRGRRIGGRSTSPRQRDR